MLHYKLRNCTKEEGIELLELAGYKVKENANTFSIWEDDKKIYGCSNKNWLEQPAFLMKNFIQKRSFNLGVEHGKEKIRTEFKTLLDL